MKFKVTVKEVHSMVLIVDALDREDAIEKAVEKFSEKD